MGGRQKGRQTASQPETDRDRQAKRHRYTGRQAGEQTQTGRQTDTDRQTGKKTQTFWQADRLKGKKTQDILAGRQANRHRHRQKVTDRLAG